MRVREDGSGRDEAQEEAEGCTDAATTTTTMMMMTTTSICFLIRTESLLRRHYAGTLRAPT